MAHCISFSPGQHFGASRFTVVAVGAAVTAGITFGRGGGMHMHGASFDAACVAVAVGAMSVFSLVSVITPAVVVVVLATRWGVGVLVSRIATTAMTGAMNATNAATNTHPLTRGRPSSTTCVASTGVNRENIVEFSVALAMMNGRWRGSVGL